MIAFALIMRNVLSECSEGFSAGTGLRLTRNIDLRKETPPLMVTSLK